MPKWCEFLQKKATPSKPNPSVAVEKFENRLPVTPSDRHSTKRREAAKVMYEKVMNRKVKEK